MKHVETYSEKSSQGMNDPYEIEVEFLGEKRKTWAYPKKSGGFVFWSPFNGQRVRVQNTHSKKARRFKPLPPISFWDAPADIPPKHCLFCGNPAGSRHHLIPRSEGGKGNTVKLCRPCHVSVHRLFTNRELANRFNTVVMLKEEFAKRYQLSFNPK